jgi:two-component system, chemotaxis family, protein-glutamate methylesterase/glutaminase
MPHLVVGIGGSAGSLQTIRALIEALPPKLSYAVVIVMHRLRNVQSDMTYILSDNEAGIKVKEPEDKQPIRKGGVYLAPQNYHLLIEEDRCFSLDYSEQVNHSRPSIDVTFESIADVYQKNAVGILLSGANDDGAEGISSIIKNGGKGIVQNPESTDFPYMPKSAIYKNAATNILSVREIIDYLHKINHS